MIADPDAQADSPIRAPVLIAASVASWFSLVLLLGSVVVSGQISQAEDEFQLRVSALEREVASRLQVNEAVLESVAAFARSTTDEQTLHRYVGELQASFAHISSVFIQTHEQLPREVPADDGMLRIETAAGQFSYRTRPIGVLLLSEKSMRPSAGFSASLSRAVARTLERGEPVASQPFRLQAGEWAYALFHPVRSQEAANYGDVLAGLIVRVDDLLSSSCSRCGGLNIAMIHPDDPDRPLLNRPWEPLKESSHGLFPRLRHAEVLEVRSQPFLLTVEQQLGWNVLAPPLLAASGVVAVAGLGLVLAYTRSRLRREQDARRLTKRLYVLANYDTLTGLPNRNLLRDRLHHALSRAARHKARIAVLFLDLDGFKAVNDTAGHAVGDGLLVNVAQRLRDCVRAQDTVGRLSGDEFVIVLEDVGDRGDAERVVRQVHDCFIQPISIDGFDFLVAASIGVALYPEDGVTVDELLRRADHAMYAVKHPGGAART